MAENAATKQRGKPFPKGTSGNPAGKPIGTRHKATRAALTLLEGEGEALTRKAVELALAGDTTALRLCMDRIASPLRERPLPPIDLPRLEQVSDAPMAVATVMEALGNGSLTPSEAKVVIDLVEAWRKTIETADLELRIQLLERGQERGDL